MVYVIYYYGNQGWLIIFLFVSRRSYNLHLAPLQFHIIFL